MNSSFKFPFYALASLMLIGLYVFVNILFIIQDILIPIIFATIISILINPSINYLVNKKINRGFAIAFVLFVLILIFAALILSLISQASLLNEALPRLSAKFQELLKQGVSWVSSYFNISVRKINVWINETQNDIINNSSGAIGLTLTTLGGALSIIFLTPVYIFMLLFYKPHLVEFVHKLFGSSNERRVSEILTETKGIIQSYLLGLSVEFILVATLNSVGLFYLGIDYPILLGILGSILNVIPYVGGLIAIILFMIIALITKPPVFIIYVFILYAIIQFVDNNFIVPKIVGSKVKLNAFICLIAVILGAALWGIPGMFLSIPITAILKLIFDKIPDLKPWGVLLGDTTPPLIRFKKKLRNV